MRPFHYAFLLATFYAWSLPFSATAQETHVDTADWLHRQIGSGADADFSALCAKQKSEGCSRVDASILRAALLEKNEKTDQQIVVRGAEIVGDFDLSGASIGRRLSFVGCHFHNKVVMVGTSFERDLLIDNSTFSLGIFADNVHIGGQFFVRNKSLIEGGDFDITNAYVKSDISIADSDVRGQLKLERATVTTKVLIQTSSFGKGISASFIDIGGSLNLGPKVHVKGLPMSFRAASVGGRLDLVDSNIDSQMNFVDMNIKGNVLFSNAEMTDVSDFSGSKIFGDFRIRNSNLRHDVIAQRLKIGGSLILTDNMHLLRGIDIRDSDIEQDLQISKSTLDGTFDAQRTRVNGTVEIERDKINGKMDFTDSIIGVDLALKNAEYSTYVSGDNVDDGIFFLKGAHIGGNIYIGPSINEKSGGFNLLEVNVGGNIEISDSLFSSNFLLPLAHINQSVFIHDTTFSKNILMNGTDITQHLDLAGNDLGSVDLSRTNIGGDFRLAPDPNHHYKHTTRWQYNSILDFRYAKLGVIQDENENYPNDRSLWPRFLDLRGLEYQGFGDSRDIQWAENWLSKQRGISLADADKRGTITQPYKSLANYFKTIGDDQGGDTLLYDAKEKDKNIYFDRCRAGHVLYGLGSCLSYFEMYLWRGIDYGVGSWQVKTLLYIVIFTLTGVVVLRGSSYAQEKGLGWRFGASLNRLIPVLDLSEEFKQFFEKPIHLKKWHTQYFYVHAIAGFMLASFVLAALAGLTQSK